MGTTQSSTRQVDPSARQDWTHARSEEGHAKFANDDFSRKALDVSTQSPAVAAELRRDYSVFHDSATAFEWIFIAAGVALAAARVRLQVRTVEVRRAFASRYLAHVDAAAAYRDRFRGTAAGWPPAAAAAAAPAAPADQDGSLRPLALRDLDTAVYAHALAGGHTVTERGYHETWTDTSPAWAAALTERMAQRNEPYVAHALRRVWAHKAWLLCAPPAVSMAYYGLHHDLALFESAVASADPDAAFGSTHKAWPSFAALYIALHTMGRAYNLWERTADAYGPWAGPALVLEDGAVNGPLQPRVDDTALPRVVGTASAFAALGAEVAAVWLVLDAGVFALPAIDGMLASALAVNLLRHAGSSRGVHTPDGIKLLEGGALTEDEVKRAAETPGGDEAAPVATGALAARFAAALAVVRVYGHAGAPSPPPPPLPWRRWQPWRALTAWDIDGARALAAVHSALRFRSGGSPSTDDAPAAITALERVVGGQRASNDDALVATVFERALVALSCALAEAAGAGVVAPRPLRAATLPDAAGDAAAAAPRQRLADAAWVLEQRGPGWDALREEFRRAGAATHADALAVVARGAAALCRELRGVYPAHAWPEMHFHEGVVWFQYAVALRTAPDGAGADAASAAEALRHAEGAFEACLEGLPVSEVARRARVLRAYSYVQDRRGRPLLCYRALRAAAMLAPHDVTLWADLLDQISDLRVEAARLEASAGRIAGQELSASVAEQEQLREARAAIASEGEVRGRIDELEYDAAVPAEEAPFKDHLRMLKHLVAQATRQNQLGR